MTYKTAATGVLSGEIEDNALTVWEGDDRSRVVFSGMGLPVAGEHGEYVEWARWAGYSVSDAPALQNEIERLVEIIEGSPR